MADAGTGIVGAQLLDEAGAVQRSCARRPTARSLIGQALLLDRALPRLMPSHFMTEWDHGEDRAVDQVMGAFLMIRRPLFASLGGFDERFFVYYEDVDLCARAWDAGLAVRHLAGVGVRHEGQGTTRAAKAHRLACFLESQIRYAAKHHGRATALALVATAFGAQVPLRLVQALARRSGREAGEVLRGAGLLARAMPGLLRTIGAPSTPTPPLKTPPAP
jgi:GT2 family glycosyltransferase